MHTEHTRWVYFDLMGGVVFILGHGLYNLDFLLMCFVTNILHSIAIISFAVFIRLIYGYWFALRDFL